MSIDSKVNVSVTEHPKEGKKWFSVTDLMDMEDSAQNNCLLEPFIPRIGLIAIAGPSDCGKSTLARQLALAVATNQEEFLNYPLNVKHGKACYIATEDEHYGTKSVLEKQLTGFGIKGTESLQFIFESQNFLAELTMFLKNNMVDLVVVDAWADIFIGNPNINTDVRRALNPWSDLAKKYECCIVMLHHNVKNSEKSKPDKNMLIGSQAMEAKLRCVLELRQADNTDERHLTILKGNYLPQEVKKKPFVLKLDPNSLLFTNTSKIIEYTSNSKAKLYDKTLWLKRFEECRLEADSDRDTIGILEKKYPEEKVPKRSWFVENIKMVDGQSNAKEKDRPTIPDAMNSLLDPSVEEFNLSSK